MFQSGRTLKYSAIYKYKYEKSLPCWAMQFNCQFTVYSTGWNRKPGIIPANIYQLLDYIINISHYYMALKNPAF